MGSETGERAEAIENPFYPEALTGLCEASRLAGFNAILFHSPGSGGIDDDR